MTLNFYKLSDSPLKANKSPAAAGTATGYLKAGCSIQDPIIERVQLSGAPSDFNYMEIPEFGRKYFITDISAEEQNGLWRVSGHCDVLSTAWPNISGKTAIIRRNTNLFNLYLPDDKFPLQARRSPEVQTFSKGFTASQSGACCCVVLMGADTSA